jgi:hypothetical protein
LDIGLSLSIISAAYNYNAAVFRLFDYNFVELGLSGLVRPAGFEPRLNCGGISLRSTCRLGSNSAGIVEIKKAEVRCRTTTFFNFLVRPAGFEPAAYGFEVRASEFPNLLKLL